MVDGMVDIKAKENNAEVSGKWRGRVESLMNIESFRGMKYVT